MKIAFCVTLAITCGLMMMMNHARAEHQQPGFFEEMIVMFGLPVVAAIVVGIVQGIAIFLKHPTEQHRAT